MLLPQFDPMLATLAPRFHRDGWVYEEKYDGWRVLAYEYGRRVRLVSRTNTDHTRTLPAIAHAIVALRRSR